MISFLQRQGLPEAELILTKRSKVQDGKTKHFTVPQFVVPQTPQQIANGGAQVRALDTPRAQHPSQLAITAGDDVLEAELVDDVFHQSLYVVEADEVEAEVVEPPAARELDGWDVPPPSVKVKRNRDPQGPKWIRA